MHSFADDVLTTPPEIVLDTSYVVHALLSAQDHHNDARRFLARLADNGATLYFNRLLEVELMEVLFKVPLVERWGDREWRFRRHDRRARKRASRLLGDGLTAWDQLLTAFDWVRVELDEVAPVLSGLMTDFGLQSYDAVHTATSLVADVPAIITADASFANFPEADSDLYVPASIVDRCRELRSGRRR